MRGRLDLFFEWRAMGWVAYIPILILLIMLSYSSLIANALAKLIPAFEFSLPVFAAWWSIYVLQELLEEAGGECLFSYPLPRWKLGVGRVLFFLAVYLLLIMSLLAVVDRWSNEPLFWSLAIQFGIQSFFFAGLGFISMVFLRDTGWSLVVLVVYAVIQIITKGSLVPVLNVFMFNTTALPLSELLPPMLLPLLYGVLLFGIGQFVLSKTHRY